MTDKIPVLLLTGFLGSGKTTLLNRWLKSPELANSAVLINEFGSISLDHHLIETALDSTVILNNGCVCCTVRGELAGALNTLYKKRREGSIPLFERVIIETTGLADPAPILFELLSHPLVKQDYQLSTVITCVDAVLGMQQLDKEIEPLKQAAVADRLLITKCDLLETHASEIESTESGANPIAASAITTTAVTPLTTSLDALISRLKILNPAADCAKSHEIELSWLLKAGVYDPSSKSADVAHWLNAEKYRKISTNNVRSMATAQSVSALAHDVNRHDERIHAFCISFDEPVQWNALLKALHMLISMRGEHLLRIKGIVHVAGEERPRIIHCVQHLVFDTDYLESWPESYQGVNKKTDLVFIVRDLNSEFVELTLEHFMAATKKATATAMR
ncbi:MAG: GTP-binding protein [Pseudomonadota bacterium]